MKRSYAYVLVLLFTLVIRPSVAQVPTGQFGYIFEIRKLWDASGSYTNDADPNDIVVIDILHHVDGLITGSRTEVFDDGVNRGESTGEIFGRTFSKPPTVGARYKWIGTLSGISSGTPFVGSARGRGTAVIDPSTLMIVDNGSVRVCVAGGKCIQSDTPPVGLPLPAGMNGNWELDWDIAADGNKLTGIGTLYLSNGRVLTYQITGSYKPTNLTSKLKFIGEGNAMGTRLSLTTQGSEMDLTRLKGKVLGQKVQFP